MEVRRTPRRVTCGPLYNRIGCLGPLPLDTLNLRNPWGVYGISLAFHHASVSSPFSFPTEKTSPQPWEDIRSMFCSLVWRRKELQDCHVH
jgi:hypothetical protein